MNDKLWITCGWSEEYHCNVFGVRSQVGSQLYNDLYIDLNTPPQTDRHIKPQAKYLSYWTLISDWPWHYFTFFDKNDEAMFLEKWKQYLHSDDTDPLKSWQQPRKPNGFFGVNTLKLSIQIKTQMKTDVSLMKRNYQTY